MLITQSCPGNFPDSGIKSGFPTLQADSLLSEPPRKPIERARERERERARARARERGCVLI